MREKMKAKLLILITMFTCLALTACGSSDVITGYESGDVELGQYKGVTYVPQDVTVTDDEVWEKVQAELIEKHEQNVDVEGKTVVEDGDTVICSYTGYVDGEQFTGGTSESSEIVIGAGSMISGFEDGIIGAEIGVEKSFDVTFPEDYSINPDVAGKLATFKVLVSRIVTKELPQYTDELVATYTDYTTVPEYDDHIREELSTEKQQEADLKKKYDVFLKIIRASEFDKQAIAPHVLENRERLVTQHNQQYSKFLGVDAATYYMNYLGMTEDETTEYFDSLAKMQTEYMYVLAAIADEEKIEVTETEIDELAEKMVTGNGYETVDELFDALVATYGVPARDVVASQARLNKATELVLNEALAN